MRYKSRHVAEQEAVRKAWEDATTIRGGGRTMGGYDSETEFIKYAPIAPTKKTLNALDLREMSEEDLDIVCKLLKEELEERGERESKC